MTPSSSNAAQRAEAAPTQPSASWAIELGRLADLLDAEPAANLDHVLDAAARAFARFGLARTSVNDIAREAGLSRSSIYRIAGTPEAILRMLIGRDLRAAITSAVLQDLPDDPPSIIVQITAAFVDAVQSHPVLRKIRDDEPELVAARVNAALPVMISLVSSRVATLLEPAVAARALAFDDSESAAQLIVRVAVSCLIAPPTGDTRTFLTDTLIPALTPPR